MCISNKKLGIICAYVRFKSDSVYLIYGSFHSAVDRFSLDEGEMQKAVREQIDFDLQTDFQQQPKWLMIQGISLS